MYTLENLIRHSDEMVCEVDGKWIPARPFGLPFMMRLSDAWRVLKGEADAFIWPGGQ